MIIITGKTDSIKLEKAMITGERKAKEVFEKQLNKQKEIYDKITMNNNIHHTNRVKEIKIEYNRLLKKKMIHIHDKYKVQLKNKDEKIKQLYKEKDELKKTVAKSKKAYKTYIQFSEYINTIAEDLETVVELLLTRHSNSYQSVQALVGRLDHYDRKLQKIQPKIHNMLGIQNVEEIEE